MALCAFPSFTTHQMLVCTHNSHNLFREAYIAGQQRRVLAASRDVGRRGARIGCPALASRKIMTHSKETRIGALKTRRGAYIAKRAPLVHKSSARPRGVTALRSMSSAANKSISSPFVSVCVSSPPFGYAGSCSFALVPNVDSLCPVHSPNLWPVPQLRTPGLARSRPGAKILPEVRVVHSPRRAGHGTLLQRAECQDRTSDL